MDETCQYNGDIDIHPFAYRTHTHGLGRVVSAYIIHDQQWTMVGKRNPQWPQVIMLFFLITFSYFLYKVAGIDFNFSLPLLGSNEVN